MSATRPPRLPLLAPPQAADFAHELPKGASEVGGQPKDAVVAADKATLQSYGRPYSAAGKPTGTFYRYARAETVPDWLS